MRKIFKYSSLALVLILGTVLRFYHNTDISLWHDEAFSALLIKYSWPEMLHRIGLDVHPPLYYILLRLWSYGFGYSLLALRGFSIFFGSATIIASYVFVSTAFKNEKAALLVALLIAINPFQLQYVTEARMYTLGAFLAILGAYFLTRALHEQKDYLDLKKSQMQNLPEMFRLRKLFIAYYLLFTLTISAMMYTHYYLFFTVAALCLYAMWYHWSHYKDNFKKYGYLITAYLLLILLYLPWLKTFVFQFKQVSQAYWIPAMDRWSIPATIWQMFIGTAIDVTQKPTQWAIISVTAFSLLLLFRFLRKTSSNEKWLVVFAILGPFLGSILFYAISKIQGHNNSVFLVRYFLFSSIFYTIALAVWLKQIRPKFVSLGLLLVYCTLNLWAFNYYWRSIDIKNKPGMYGAARFLNTNVEPNHKLFVGSSFEFFNFKYYNQTGVVPLLYSGGNTDIKNLPHFAGTAILTNEDLLPDFKSATKKGDVVWLLWTNGFGGSKPEIPKNWKQLDERNYPDVRPYVGTNIYINEYKVN